MRMRDMPLLGAFAACICASNASIASVARSVSLSFDLKPAESVLFQQIACTDRYGVLLEKAEASDDTTMLR